MDEPSLAAWAAEDLARAIREHLVHVHVRLRAAARLPHRQRELAVVLAGDHLVRRLDDRLRLFRIERLEVEVHLRCRPLHLRERPDQLRRHLLGADLEVRQRPLRLRSPQPVGGNLDGSEGVFLHARRHPRKPPWRGVHNASTPLLQGGSIVDPPRTARTLRHMVCRRCRTPLPPYAERCVRCGAPATARTAGSAASIASDPPPPVTIEFGEESDAPVVPARAPAAVGRSTAPAISSQLFAWSIDLFILLGCAGLHLIVAKMLLGTKRFAGASASADYWLDLLLRGSHLPLLWAAVAALLAVAYSWLFAVLGGRTPGLALAGLRLESVRGGTLAVDEALIRAAL